MLLLSLNLPVDDPTVTKSVVAEPVEATLNASIVFAIVNC